MRAQGSLCPLPGRNNATASNCAGSAPSRSRTARRAPGATRVPARMSPWRRNRYRSSRPARKCASDSIARAANLMIRRIAAALILVPLAIILVSLAVANRQSVVVSFDPFDPAHPALTRALPLYLLMLVILIGGVLLGGSAGWVRQGKWRRAGRPAGAPKGEKRAEGGPPRRRLG